MALEHAFGPAVWDEVEHQHIYDSGAFLRGFNDALSLTRGLLRMSVCRVLPGQIIDHHDHDTMSEIYFLMRGKGEFRVDDKVIPVQERTGMYFEPGVMRSVSNSSNDAAWWIFIGSPPDVKPGATPPPIMEHHKVPEARGGAFGPALWDEVEHQNIYSSGAFLRGFNDALSLTRGLLRMSVCRVLPGEEVDHHDHYTMSEIYFLMQGKGQFRVDDTLVDAEQGTGMYFEPGVMRSVINNSNDVNWWIFIGSPPDVKPEDHG